MLLLFACGGADPVLPAAEPEPEPEPRVATPPAAKELHAHMDEHAAALSSARDAVIAGDHEAARERLAWLATHEVTAELPAAWTTFVEAMRGAASDASKKEGIDGLAWGVAYVASECGSCHESMGKGPHDRDEPIAADGDTTRDHMIRHHEASEQMWKGLISGEDGRWLAGASALAEQEPLKDLRHPTTGAAPEGAAKLAAEVHALGAEGLGTMDRIGRAGLVGELLATCASCHAAEGVPAEGPPRAR
jgi:cytochrome c553